MLAAFITVAQPFQNNEFYSTKQYNILQTNFYVFHKARTRPGSQKDISWILLYIPII